MSTISPEAVNLDTELQCANDKTLHVDAVEQAWKCVHETAQA